MNEIETPSAATPAAPDAALTFGRRLAAERERLGLSVEDIASRLRLHPRQVQAIEREALPSLPVPFLRGFVRNYAKELRLDAEPLVAELSARLGGQPEYMVRATPATGSGPRLEPSQLASRRVVVGGAIAALVALAVLGWMATQGERRAAESALATKAQSAPATAAVSSPAGAEQAKTDATGVSVVAVAAQPAAPGAAPAAPTSGGASTSAAGVTSAAPAADVATAAPPFDGLRMSFRDQAWVEVTQGDGRVIHSQINPAGSEQRIEGKLPLRVVIGNASAVSVEFRGRAIELKPVTSPDNVARITVNESR